MNDVAAIEASGRAALPALHEEQVGGWLLRVSGGTTKRVNSANPVEPGARVLPVLDRAGRFYADHRMPCRFRLTPLADPGADRMLEERGFERIDDSWTMTARLTARVSDPALALTHVPSGPDLDRAGLLSGRAMPAQAVHLALLSAIAGPKAFAVLHDGGEPVAAGYASVGDGRAQLSDIVVRADVRGRGHGRRLVAGLLGWAHQQGCAEAMLQVLDANPVARGLYASLGFTDAYPYHYRVRP